MWLAICRFLLFIALRKMSWCLQYFQPSKIQIFWFHLRFLSLLNEFPDIVFATIHKVQDSKCFLWHISSQILFYECLLTFLWQFSLLSVSSAKEPRLLSSSPISLQPWSLPLGLFSSRITRKGGVSIGKGWGFGANSHMHWEWRLKLLPWKKYILNYYLSDHKVIW